MKSKKAISLIVLVITIIVMIILASAIIISLDNTNIFNKAEEAVDKTNAKTNMYLSELKLAERELEKIQGVSKVTDSNPGELRVEDDTYYIESIDDLVYFSKLVSGTVEGKEVNSFAGKTVKLTRLLDFNSDNSYVDKSLKETLTGANGSSGFTPIGTEAHPFKGTFDGDGTEIRNLYINITDNEEIAYAGLFGYAEGIALKNLGITGKIYGNYNAIVGGIIGTAYTKGKPIIISNCYNKAEIVNSSYCGGIAGDLYEEDENEIIIQDCYNVGNIICNKDYGSQTSSYGAGITCGLSYGTINRCYNLGNIDYLNVTSGFAARNS